MLARQHALPEILKDKILQSGVKISRRMVPAAIAISIIEDKQESASEELNRTMQDALG